VQSLRSQGKYRDLLCAATIDHIVKSTPLHDIGKVGVPGHTLLKPAGLTKEEFDEMKKHPIYGSLALRRTGARFVPRLCRGDCPNAS
jgi:putative two-component system response regulator